MLRHIKGVLPPWAQLWELHNSLKAFNSLSQSWLKGRKKDSKSKMKMRLAAISICVWAKVSNPRYDLKKKMKFENHTQKF